jgi:polyferredoxin
LSRGFCSWICPVGTISEGIYRLGERFRLTLHPPRFIDIPLRSLKYLLLLFFLFAILSMDSASIDAFASSPYNKIADVKMLLFFLNLSTVSIVVLINLFIWSVFIKNFWCRYLCPYGALLGILSKVSPVKIARDERGCIDCRKCEKACPAYIDITKAKTIRSAECIGCMDCVEACPVEKTLEIKNAVIHRSIEPGKYGLILVGGFIALMLLAQLTGHWQTNVTLAEYKQLIPEAASYGHP